MPKKSARNRLQAWEAKGRGTFASEVGLRDTRQVWSAHARAGHADFQVQGFTSAEAAAEALIAELGRAGIKVR